MSHIYSIDAFSPTASYELRDYFNKLLKPILNDNKVIIFLCIGTDRSTGDSLGPLIGHKLKKYKFNKIYIYGSLENPIHSNNIVSIIDKIKLNFTNPFIIAIDAALGTVQNIGKILIETGPLLPGSALNKNLPCIGNMSIKGIVNICGHMEFIILQNTRLYTVMTLADSIANGIALFSSKMT